MDNQHGGGGSGFFRENFQFFHGVVKAVNAEGETDAGTLFFRIKNSGEVIVTTTPAQTANAYVVNHYFKDTARVIAQSARKGYVKLKVVFGGTKSFQQGQHVAKIRNAFFSFVGGRKFLIKEINFLLRISFEIQYLEKKRKI